MRKVTDTEPITLDELRQMLGRRFSDMMKGVLDLRRGVLVVDAEMHADQEAELLAEGSIREDLRGDQPLP